MTMAPDQSPIVFASGEHMGSFSETWRMWREAGNRRISLWDFLVVVLWPVRFSA
jgi:hypothetical protein